MQPCQKPCCGVTAALPRRPQHRCLVENERDEGSNKACNQRHTPHTPLGLRQNTSTHQDPQQPSQHTVTTSGHCRAGTIGVRCFIPRRYQLLILCAQQCPPVVSSNTGICCVARSKSQILPKFDGHRCHLLRIATCGKLHVRMHTCMPVFLASLYPVATR